jgi:hypothetical protein
MAAPAPDNGMHPAAGAPLVEYFQSTRRVLHRVRRFSYLLVTTF